MSFDLQKILESKRALRRDLAARPVGEKLRMLDALRERELAFAAGRCILFPALHVRNLPPTAPSQNECVFGERQTQEDKN